MNFIDGRISKDGKLVELPEGLRLALNADTTDGHEGGEVTVGIRPEHFALTEPEQSTFPLTVDHAEFHGADTIVYGRLKNNDEVIVARLPHIHRVDSEKPLFLAVMPECIHLFDKNSGKRL